MEQLKKSNFVFHKDLLTIFFPKAKNDQFYEGKSTLFERNGTIYCPVFITYKYFQRLGYKGNCNGYFLPQVVNTRVARLKGRNIYVKEANPKKHISYDTALKDRRRLLDSLGLPGDEFTEHSDKTGGITKIVNSGAPLEDAQTHGRWASLQVAHKYVQKNEAKKRKLSKFFFKND